MVPVYARRIKKVTLPEAGSRVECPRNINRLKQQQQQQQQQQQNDLWYDDLRNE